MRDNFPLKIRVVGRACQHLLLILALFLSGCASDRFDLSKTTAVPQGEGVVFGRVKVTSDGKIENLSRAFGKGTFSIVILPDTSSEGITIPLKKEGYFFWHIQSGGYTIAGFQLGSSLDYIRGRIFAHFDVTRDKVMYIGTLTMVFDRGGKTRKLMEALGILDAKWRYVMFVEDEFDSAEQEFRKRFPEIREDITKSLMVMEQTR